MPAARAAGSRVQLNCTGPPTARVVQAANSRSAPSTVSWQLPCRRAEGRRGCQAQQAQVQDGTVAAAAAAAVAAGAAAAVAAEPAGGGYSGSSGSRQCAATQGRGAAPGWAHRGGLGSLFELRVSGSGGLHRGGGGRSWRGRSGWHGDRSGGWHRGGGRRGRGCSLGEWVSNFAGPPHAVHAQLARGQRARRPDIGQGRAGGGGRRQGEGESGDQGAVLAGGGGVDEGEGAGGGVHLGSRVRLHFVALDSGACSGDGTVGRGRERVSAGEAAARAGRADVVWQQLLKAAPR